MFDCNLTQHVSQLTHIKGNILDLVLTSPTVTIENISVNPQVLSTFSDHFTISFDISCCPFLQGHQKPSYAFDFSKANFTDLCSFLLDFDFSACFQSYDIEFIWSTIKSIIFVAISLFVPKTYLKQRQEPKWFNSDIRHHPNCLRSLKKKLNSCPSPHRLHQYKLFESSLIAKAVEAKAQYETNLINSFSSKNSSAIYRYIRTITNQNTIPPSVTFDDKCAVSDFHKACLFNKYFHSIFTRSSFQLPPSSELLTPQSYLSEIEISELDVYNALISLDSSGCDGISAKILKKVPLPSTSHFIIYFP